MKTILCRVPAPALAPALAFAVLLFVLCPAWSHAGPPFAEFIDPNPNAGNQFGHTVVALSTGNVVITSPYDDAGGSNAGAVYLFNGATGALIRTLQGSQTDDYVGGGGVTALSNGNYVVNSPFWNNAAGAVTWGSGTSGVSGAVTSSNSLVGTSTYDQVGSRGVTALSNGNYVVRSSYWDNAGVVNAGAVTWGSGTSGVSGAVTSSNSLVGTTASDQVGYYGVTALSNGSYVVRNPTWDNAGVKDAGAVTWGSGTSGVSGVVTSSNSLVGTNAYDNVGDYSVTALSNGNYVVSSASWDNVGMQDAGAVTWGSGTSGISGAVTSSNSLVGTTAYDSVGNSGVTALSNGNYVVSSPYWNNAGVAYAGAVTWGNGTSGVNGAVTSSNSLVGTTAHDEVGASGVTALTNGNYVVSSKSWDNASVVNAGAVTWGSGTSGLRGAVTSSNSLVGTTGSNYVGSSGVTALNNGNYVVSSPYWDNAGVIYAGAVTWGNGTSGVKGTVTSSNSLVGTTASDQVGYSGVTALTNGNYVVSSVSWNNAGVMYAGAMTWGSGTSGISGVVTSSNSLVGTNAYDQVGAHGVKALSNGNYVVNSPFSDSAGVQDAGAVTWGNGTSGVSGAVTSSNSLVGLANNTNLQTVVTDAVNGTYFGRFLDEGSGKVRLGSQAAGLRLSAVVQTLVFMAPLKLYLAENPVTLSASSSSYLPVIYTVLSGPATVSGNVLTLTNVGTVKLRASQPGNAYFLAATPVERTITVAANPTSMALMNLNQTYTGTPRPITLLGAPEEVDVTYKVGLSYVFTPPINAGSYPVKAEAGEITKTGTLIITKAPLFVQPDDQRKFAGQSNPLLGFSYSGLLDDDNPVNSVSKAPVIATTATATSPGGLYPITASGGTSANYLFVYMKGTMKVETFAASYEAMLMDTGTPKRPSAKLELTVAASSKTFTAKLTTPTAMAVVGLPGTLTTNTLSETATGTATVKVGLDTYLVIATMPLTGDFTAEAKRNGTPLGTATNGQKLLTLTTGQTLSYIGTHSALLAPAAPGVGVPAGAGWAVATIDAKGLLKLAGKLADGTTLTASLAADVSSNPGYRLFLQPYTPARTGAFIAGAFALKPHPDLTGRRYVAFEDAADLTWVKARRVQDPSYRAGFGPVDTRFTLDPWLLPAQAKGLVPAITLTQRLGLTAPQFTAKHSTIISASFAYLPTNLGLNATTNVVSVIAPDTVPANATKWKVTVTPTTGAFVGSFELADGKKRTVPFTGIMRQPPSTDLSGLIGDGNFQLPSLLVAPNNEVLSGEVGFEK